MSYMFLVRSARVLPPTALSRALPVHATCVAATQRPHASRAAPLLSPHARLLTRQRAYAFNQPLSFDTSKVTDMHWMFMVRSARAPQPSFTVGLSPCMPLASLSPPRPPASGPAGDNPQSI